MFTNPLEWCTRLSGYSLSEEYAHCNWERWSVKIYFYKMTVDSGGAPCVHRGLLSLAICKPEIRRMADLGDLVIGFGGARLQGRLIYAAYVTEKPEPGDYYRERRFRQRPDRIYRMFRGLAIRRATARFHFETNERKRDVGRRFEKAFVLLSDNFRYFGSAGTADYRARFRRIAMALRSLTQGHRVNHPRSLRKELLQLVKELWCEVSRKVNGQPSDADRSRRCNTETGPGSC